VSPALFEDEDDDSSDSGIIVSEFPEDAALVEYDVGAATLITKPEDTPPVLGRPPAAEAGPSKRKAIEDEPVLMIDDDAEPEPRRPAAEAPQQRPATPPAERSAAQATQESVTTAPRKVPGSKPRAKTPRPLTRPQPAPKAAPASPPKKAPSAVTASSPTESLSVQSSDEERRLFEQEQRLEAERRARERDELQTRLNKARTPPPERPAPKPARKQSRIPTDEEVEARRLRRYNAGLYLRLTVIGAFVLGALYLIWQGLDQFFFPYGH
jgi:hypothetical protein